MSSRHASTLLPLVGSYFRDHLVRARGASPHTVRSYRDALRLLFGFIADRRHRSVADVTLEDLQAPDVLAFLSHLESKRSNVVASRNVRLAAIRSFFKHLVEHDLSRADQYQRVLAIPGKRAHIPMAQYLEPEDVKQILAQPDRSTESGLRDHALLLLLYNTGARVSEALGVRAEHLSLGNPRHVRLFGKGNKERICPLWRDTAAALQRLQVVRSIQPQDWMFCSRGGACLTRDGAAYILQKVHGLGGTRGPNAATPTHHTPRAATQLRRCLVASRGRYNRDPRLPRPCQHIDDQPLRDHQPANEARGPRALLGALRPFSCSCTSVVPQA
jgi:site-specific recombinase XerD